MLSDLLATEGLWFLVFGVVLGGIVRGFSGFGTAMVYLPIAAQFIPPVWVLITLCVFDIIGPIPAARKAWSDSQPTDLKRLAIGAALGVPLGLFVLTALPVEVFRYAVSCITVLLLVLLVSGVRYRGTVPPAMVYGTGSVGGFFNGAVGLPGPPVILLYMARPLPVASIRANILLYLIISDVLFLAVIGARGLLEWMPILVGFFLLVPYVIAVQVGTAVFDPKRESVYRWVAYAIIAVSAVSGLPIWD